MSNFTFSVAGAAIILLLFFGVCGLFASIFYGVIWLVTMHWVISLCVGLGLWIAASFVIRILIEVFL